MLHYTLHCITLLCLQSLPSEKKKKNLFGKKLSFAKGKDRSGSEDALNVDERKWHVLREHQTFMHCLQLFIYGHRCHSHSVCEHQVSVEDAKQFCAFSEMRR